MKSYEQLQAFLDSVQQRKMGLNDQKNVLLGQRSKLQEQWEDCVFSGEGVEEAKQNIADLDNRIDDISDHIKILEQKVKTSSKVRELAQAVWNDCHHTVQGVRNNYLSQAEKTRKARDTYLRELSILGEIARVGSKYSFFASEASTYLPETVHVGLNADKFAEVSLDTDLVKRTYKNGK